MLFDAPRAEPNEDGRLLHWFLRGGLIGILLLTSGILLPARWEHMYRLLCPATNPEIAYSLGLSLLSSSGAIIWLLLILASQFVIYGVIAFGVGYLRNVIRTRSGPEAR